ncbi:TonB-dependent siderophore receptor [Phaeobacter sp. HF9A]|uniref:TonB-dependent siderophore receptor n=1 Tax=Phaeobacter sp. HF9A TaxID=2721561 RepID=UPI0014321074|nr:TonB-dependent siderophore receptor [Phaeobacter sp. HF9A]NIZ12292.1 TonB-dependent siderophore receptor [Phaeobacter sp. HF9A]
MTLTYSPAPCRSRRPHTLWRGTLFAACSLAALPAQAQDQVIELAPIIVRDKLQYAGAIEGYLAPATETGVKSGVPLSEVPQSISVVTSSELERRQPAQVEDAIKYTAGINPSSWGTDDRFDQFSIRGFDMGSTSLYRDGLPQKVLGFTAFSSDPYMLERVDVLRGPAGVLYGANDAGGMINLVTKRPSFEPLAKAYAGYGSHGTVEAGADWSAVLNAQGTLAGRLTLLLRDGATEVQGSANDRALISGGLTWAPSDDTSLTVLMHYQKDARTPLIFAPVPGEDANVPAGSLPQDFALRQSPYNSFKTEQASFGWEFAHRFGAGFTFNQKLRYARQKTDYAQLDYSDASASGLSYYAFNNDEDAWTLGFDNNLEWKSGTGRGENSLIAGFDYQYSRSDVTQYLDYSTYLVPYTDPNFDFAVSQPALGARGRTTYSEKGLYLQDHFKFDTGLSITAGLRHSWLETKVEDWLAGSSETQKDSATTGMIGLTYEMANGMVPYVSYTEGFIQNVGKTISGAPLDPSKSKQWELGLRYLPDNGNYMLSAALFDLRKTNVKDYDLNDPTWSSFTQVGEIRSRGLELEARGRLTDRLQGVLGYSYLESEITRSSDASKLGNENAMAPPHQLSLWLDYDAADLLPGLTAGAGLRYNAAAFSTQDNLRKTPSYAVADLALRYQWQNLDINFRVANLFDRDYFGVCYDSYGCVRGQGRTAMLTVGTSF